jgi:hypothetical protein
MRQSQSEINQAFNSDGFEARRVAALRFQADEKGRQGAIEEAATVDRNFTERLR